MMVIKIFLMALLFLNCVTAIVRLPQEVIETLQIDIEDRSHNQLFYNNSLNDIFNNTNSDNQSDKVIIHNGRTVALLELTTPDVVNFCNLSIVDEMKKRRYLRKWYSNSTVKLVNFHVMMLVVETCDKLSLENYNLNNTDDQVEEEEIKYWRIIISGVMPGTLWCGVNDNADNYEDLGSNTNLDRCCRAHDHCPQKIKAFKSKQGLANISPYTKSHCMCDMKFYDCLKLVNSSGADTVAKFYFNFLNLQCIDHTWPKRCLSWKNSTDDSDQNLAQLKEDIIIRKENLIETEENIFNNTTINEIESTENDNNSMVCLESGLDYSHPPVFEYFKLDLKF